MKLLLCIIIVVMIFYIFIDTNNYDFYTIKTDSATTPSTKSTEESYTYSGCIGCVTTSNSELKPSFNYMISDNRCIKNNTTGYINNSYLTNLTNYSDPIPNTAFTTCTDTYNSLYSSVVGKYIMIYRTDTQPIKFRHISVHSRDGVVLSNNNNIIYTTNLTNRDGSGNYIYPETALNSLDSNSTLFISGVTSGIAIPTYVILTLTDNMDIGYINIKHVDSNDAGTLNNAILAIFKDDPTIDTDPTSAVLAFYTVLTGSNINRIIYTYNYKNPVLLPSLSDPMDLTHEWNMPCDNCASRAGFLFRFHKYRFSSNNDIRCFLTKLPNMTNRSILDRPMTATEMETNFFTCNAPYDTRYYAPLGHLIHIGKFIAPGTSSGDPGFSIIKLRIYSDYRNTAYTDSELSAFVRTYVDDSHLIEKALDNDDNTSMVTTADYNSKILINLGHTTAAKRITGVELKVLCAEKEKLFGVRIYVIRVDTSDPYNIGLMKVVGYRDIDRLASEIIDQTKCLIITGLNETTPQLLSVYPDIQINHEMLYNTNSPFLSTYKRSGVLYQLPYVIYSFANTRKILAKTSVPVINTLDKINASDALTLFNFNTNPDMKTIPGNSKSHLLLPAPTRYIQIIPGTGMTFSTSVIRYIFAYTVDNNGNPSLVLQANNPTLVKDTSRTDSYLTWLLLSTDITANILLDIGQESSIYFIKITIDTSKYINLQSATINLINTNHERVYTYVFPSTLTSTTNDYYLVTDAASVNQVAGTYFLKKFSYSSCRANGFCKEVAPGIKYILDDGRCFLSSASTNPTNCPSSTCFSLLNSVNKLNNLTNVVPYFESCGVDETRWTNPVYYEVIMPFNSSPTQYISNTVITVARSQNIHPSFRPVYGTVPNPLQIVNGGNVTIGTTTTSLNGVYLPTNMDVTGDNCIVLSHPDLFYIQRGEDFSIRGWGKVVAYGNRNNAARWSGFFQLGVNRGSGLLLRFDGACTIANVSLSWVLPGGEQTGLMPRLPVGQWHYIHVYRNSSLPNKRINIEYNGIINGYYNDTLSTPIGDTGFGTTFLGIGSSLNNPMETFCGYIANFQFIRGIALPSGPAIAATPYQPQMAFEYIIVPFNKLAMPTYTVNTILPNLSVTPNGTIDISTTASTVNGVSVSNVGIFNNSSLSISGLFIIDPNENFTIQFWFYATIGTTALFGTGNTTNVYNISLGLVNSYLTVWFTATGGTVTSSTLRGISLNTWHFITIVKSSTSSVIYLNGTLAYTIIGSSGVRLFSEGILYIGRKAGWVTDTNPDFTGRISDFYYAKGLSLEPTVYINPGRA